MSQNAQLLARARHEVVPCFLNIFSAFLEPLFKPISSLFLAYFYPISTLFPAYFQPISSLFINSSPFPPLASLASTYSAKNSPSDLQNPCSSANQKAKASPYLTRPWASRTSPTQNSTGSTTRKALVKTGSKIQKLLCIFTTLHQSSMTIKSMISLISRPRKISRLKIWLFFRLRMGRRAVVGWLSLTSVRRVLRWVEFEIWVFLKIVILKNVEFLHFSCFWVKIQPVFPSAMALFNHHTIDSTESSYPFNIKFCFATQDLDDRQGARPTENN